MKSLTVFILTLALIAAMAVTTATAQEIHIPDAELARAIRHYLGLDAGAPITAAAMRELTVLRGGFEIVDLTGLQHATNLEMLYLSWRKKVSDVSPLANLPKLERLYLEHTQVSDISPLANLPNLKELELNNTKVSDVSPLATLTNLFTLGLDQTNVSDISTLANLPNLEWLGLSVTQVWDVAPLANLPKLKGVSLFGCPLNAAAYDTHIPALQAKGVTVSFDKDAAPVAEPPVVAPPVVEPTVDLTQPIHIPDAALANAIREALELGEGAPITAAAMRELTELDLRLFRLGSFTLREHVTSLFGIENATNLKRLEIGVPYSVLVNLGEVPLLPNLGEALWGVNRVPRRNKLKDISPLANLTQLERLNLDTTDVSDISALARLTNLKELDLDGTNVSDISALAKLTNLEKLYLEGTDVSDISALARLTNLKELDLSGTDVSDISPLARLTNLKELDIQGWMLNRAAYQTHIPALQAKGITVHFWEKNLRVCTSSIPENLETLQPVRIKPITQKKRIVQDGDGDADAQASTVKFAPQVDSRGSRAWTTGHTVIGEKYGKLNLSTVIITAKILNGTAAQKTMIKDAAADWERNGNLFFRFVESGEADVQISINTKKDSDGGWATIGKDTASRMELHNDFSYGTCLHEFGHVLGLTHEHQSPRFLELVKWAYEGEELIAELRKDGIPHWSEEQIRRSILTRHEVGPAAKFDPDSIMTYDFSSKLFKARPNAPNPTLANEIATNGTKSNSELSADDKALLRHIYGPPGGQQALVEGSISIDGVDDESWKVKWKPIKVAGFTVGWLPDGWKDDETIHESESFGPKFFSSIDEYALVSEDPVRFKWGGECRVEVYLSTRKIVEDSHIEMAANVFFFEGSDEITADLEDFKCVDFDIPLTNSKYEKEVTLTVNNKFWQDEDRPFLAIDARARRCRSVNIEIDINQDWLSFRGDVFGGGDRADITISLSAKPIKSNSLTELLAEAEAAAKAAAAPAAATVKHRPSQKLSDVNGDGQVTVADLMLVSNHIGQTTPSDSRVDLNADGIVTIVDLVQVAQHLGQSRDPAAPAHIVAPKGLAYETVEGWLNRARAADDGSQPFLQGITNLERLLLLIIPKKTALLHNYPNPFNPETWIPYHLAEPAEVTLTLYTADGKVVRTLALGHQPAGFYQSRSRAAYWDGRNEVGERVASGVYFYTLTAGEFSTTRKMVIRK